MITIDGNLMHSFPLRNPQTLNDVKVFAGDNDDPPSDASYKNLVWENFPVPYFLFNKYTPAIVSLENKIILKRISYLLT